MPATVIGDHCHGKIRVRVARKWTDENGMHHFMDLTASVLTFSDATLPAFTEGDNSFVVATDTCKNVAYHVMKEHQCTSPDHFAVMYCRTMLEQYQFMHKVETHVEERVWDRMHCQGEPHQHAFQAGPGTERNTCKVTLTRSARVRGGELQIESGIKDMGLLKTTKSSWYGFHSDEYRTLPDTGERLLATELTLSWRYVDNPDFDQFNAIRAQVRKGLVEGFSGPPSEGVHSPGVQKSLYDMGNAVMTTLPNLSWMRLTAPNIHFIPAPALAAVGKYKFEDDVYLPTDEPRGIIDLVLTKTLSSKL